MNSEQIYGALTHAEWEGETDEVDSVYTLADCEAWLEKPDHPTIDAGTISQLKAIDIVPNALIRERYLQAMGQCNSGVEGHPQVKDWQSDSLLIHENIRVAYNELTGKDLSRTLIVDRIRYGLGFAPKYNGKRSKTTMIFLEREFAEAIVKALSIAPHEVGI